MTTRLSATPARLTWEACLVAMVVLWVAPLGAAWPAGGAPVPLPQPTEAQMGAPVCPGAAYDGQMSGGLSQGEWYCWVFATTDPVGKVVAFYKQTTGLVPIEIEGNFQFTIRKGENPYFPNQGFPIEPDKMFRAGPRTAITFIRKK